MCFFCQNNIGLKYTSSLIQQVEVYLKYTSNILWKYTSSIFEVCILNVYFTLVKVIIVNIRAEGEPTFKDWRKVIK